VCSSDLRLALSDEAVAIARRLDDSDTLAHALITRCSATLDPGSLDRRLADAAELADLARSLADPATRTRALVMAYRVILLAGRLNEADPLLEEADDLAQELGQPSLRWITSFLRAGRLIVAGRLEEAERVARDADEIGALKGQIDARWGFACQLFAIRSQQDRADDEVLRLLDTTKAEYVAADGHLDFVDLTAAIAGLRLGHFDEARAGFERIVSLAQPVEYYAILNDVLMAELAIRLGEWQAAEAAYTRLAPHTRWVVAHAGFPVPGVSFHLGLLASFLGRFADADAHFERAAADYERAGAPSLLALTRLEWARMLLSGGDPDHGVRLRSFLEAAAATARDLGLGGIERDAAALLND